MSFPQGPGQPNNNGNPFNNPFRQNGNNGGKGDKPNRANGGNKPFWQSPWLWGAVVVILVITMFQMFTGMGTQTIDTKDGLELLKDGQVSYAKIVDNKQKVTLQLKNDYTKRDADTGKTHNYGKNVQFYYTFAQGQDIVKAVEKADPSKGWSADIESSSMMAYLIQSILPFIIFFAFAWFLMSRMGAGSMLGMGGKKNNGKLLDGQTPKTKFSDVAGEDEALAEVEEIKDFLKDPSKYKALGARIPRGVLLYGPPGTGKTLLARAIAGEAGVPFYSMAGSDFVEMFVGLGASRVRDLFDEAKKNAPCIIFIDEIDAIGKSRNAGGYGGNDEREQTLNQLLSEMDGFDSSKGILILAATNRPEVLDQALLRPGRFDRRVIVDKPDLEGRIQILKVHAKNVKMDETVDFREVALATSGAVGADLANMINEAAILAVRNHRQAVSQKDLLDSVEVVLVGKEKKSRVLSKEERKIVSYHEVGHALVSAIQKHSEPVQKITIVPRTMGALGYVMNVPEEEKYLNSEEEIRAMLVEFTAGRVAEELVFGSITTGASNDIEKATRIARAMVTQYGMSKRFGFVQLESQTSQYLDDGRRVMNCSEQTAAEVDEEVMAIMKQSYEQARKILTEHRKALDQIAAFLIEKETITGKEFMDILAKVDQPDLAAGTESTETPQA